MFGSATIYTGLLATLVGLGLTIRPIAWLYVSTRGRALTILCGGILFMAIGAVAPTFESRVPVARDRLDEFVSAWHFHEVHSLRVAAPPDRVFEAIKQVRADEISLFRTLTWIRRGGRSAPPSILNAGREEPLINVAVNGGFVRLAESAPRELVLGTVVVAPPGPRPAVTGDLFRRPPDGFALASMNFKVTPDGPTGSVVSTETRVFATSAAARRRFAVYWRLIYPGSALIRRMWLRAIARRATQ
jgi:hypothetical protein